MIWQSIPSQLAKENEIIKDILLYDIPIVKLYGEK